MGRSLSKRLTECLDRNIFQLLRSLHGPGDGLNTDPVVRLGVEEQPDLPLHRHLLRHLRVVDEGFPSTASRWTISGTHILQALCNTRSGNTEKEERDKVTEYLPMMVVFPHPF